MVGECHVTPTFSHTYLYLRPNARIVREAQFSIEKTSSFESGLCNHPSIPMSKWRGGVLSSQASLLVNLLRIPDSIPIVSGEQVKASTAYNSSAALDCRGNYKGRWCECKY